jgi:hypothetical protein
VHSAAAFAASAVVLSWALHYAKVTGAANESHADCVHIIKQAEIRMVNEIDRAREAGEAAPMGTSIREWQSPNLRVCHS